MASKRSSNWVCDGEPQLAFESNSVRGWGNVLMLVALAM
jgi:hypothetical protein